MSQVNVVTKFSYIALIMFITVFVSQTVFAEQYLVNTQKGYKKALNKVKPGDEIVLANGVWSNFEILFKGYGQANKPITLTAQTKGKVILSGQSNLRLAGKYLAVSGLVFKNGYTPNSAVVSFRQNKKNLAFYSRVSEVVIDNFNNPDKQESDYWVAMYGQHNRFDHNYLVGKRNKGVTLAVRLDSKHSEQNYHLIDHNYFGPRPIFGSNGGETIRIGTSHFSLSDSFTRVENNYFDHCNGEVEIISVKSGRNKILNNVFFESRGTLTLRHGHNNLVEGNVFFGNGKDHTGGIRVINENQIIKNNYLEGLTGYRFGSGLTLMNGIYNSPINRYNQVVNALIENNSFINVAHIQLAAGSDKERTAPPKDSVIRDSLFFNANLEQPFTAFDDISGIKFVDNIANTDTTAVIKKGIAKTQIALKRASNGLMYPTDPALKNIGASRTLSPISKQQVGPDWYKKSPATVAFSSGKTTIVKANGNALFNAVKNAQSGDVLLLENGKYAVSKLIKIDKTLTIKAQQSKHAFITFERTALFEIDNGGSLALDGLVFSGTESPDAQGNTLIRTKKWGMIENYRLIMSNSVVHNLLINHQFHFFDSGKGAFADKIELTNNQFSNISGDVLRLNKEIEDLGIYNAEYVILKDNQFSNIKGFLLNLYRGGTDESTFGPHLNMNHNSVINVGNGTRNKAHASILLHGVQVTDIEDNTFSKSAKVLVEHTVGDPITTIVNNKFIDMSAPKVVELIKKSANSPIIKNNQVLDKSSLSK